MVTPFLSQIALSWGVNDLEGTVVREKIYHEAGAHTAQGLALDDLLALIRGAGRVPVERDSLYNVIRTFDDDRPPRRPDVRVGRIRYINCFPVYGAIDRGIVAARRRLS